jgi:hypothetical protein
MRCGAGRGKAVCTVHAVRLMHCLVVAVQPEPDHALSTLPIPLPSAQRACHDMDATWRMHTLRESVSKSDIWKRKVELMGEEADALRVGLEKFTQRQNRWGRQQLLQVMCSVSHAHMPILSLHGSLPPAHPCHARTPPYPRNSNSGSGSGAYVQASRGRAAARRADAAAGGGGVGGAG